MLDFIEAVGVLDPSRWAAYQWFGSFLAADKILDMLDILRYGWPDIELVCLTPLRQAYSVREAPEKLEGVAKAMLFERKLLAFAAFEFTQKLAKS